MPLSSFFLLLLILVVACPLLQVSQFWRERVIEIGKEYPDVQLTHMYVDNAAMQLIRYPKQVSHLDLS